MTRSLFLLHHFELASRLWLLQYRKPGSSIQTCRWPRRLLSGKQNRPLRIDTVQQRWSFHFDSKRKKKMLPQISSLCLITDWGCYLLTVSSSLQQSWFAELTVPPFGHRVSVPNEKSPPTVRAERLVLKRNDFVHVHKYSAGPGILPNLPLRFLFIWLLTTFSCSIKIRQSLQLVDSVQVVKAY